ncbi:MAG TPA: thioredoxin family protein [Syntrophales bacterium]|jgi:small redox-active disulfide protein 2|nr:thioredoxin family protein [Syntrophales bacterium]HOU77437.1 thioredoxin family protein [Syntrophales bacterium]HPC33690.1 thioredoxin family protein [Syntrophales bacterium]HQG35149.1 thioredoxin family protein [Syntrophales bacterium]HQI36837.1 thioredoxin family protein [Syntrophales bacterium]
MDIKVLGPGCARCVAVDKLVKEALEELKMEATIEKVKDIKEFAKYGVFSTPALVIDNQVKCAGKIPTKNEIISWLKK